jgi:DNA-binding HxlR family transcriptional regulator
VSGLAGVLFVWRSLSYAHPVVDLRALKDRNFALGCLFSFITGVGIFATIYLTPLFLGRVRGFSALQIGLAVFSTGVFQILAIPVYSFFANRVDLRWLMMFGLACFALSMWEFTPITHDWGAAELLLPQALRGIGQQFAVPPTVTLTLGGLAMSRLKLASGLFNLMRNLGGALGIAVCATLLNDRTNLHFYRLAEHLTRSNDATTALLDGRGRAPAGRKRSAGRRVRGAQAALEPHVPRGPDAHVLRCFLWHHGLLHHRHRDGAADAQGDAAQGAARRRPLNDPARKPEPMKPTTPIDPALRMKYCPVVRSLARVGERWSILILRDAFYGITRFDDFVNSLQIAPNMLTRRLTSLVEDGLLERRQYNEKPPRYEYVLTPLGRDFRPVLLALVTWGNQNFADEGRSVVLKERETGRQVDPVLIDSASGKPITEVDYVLVQGAPPVRAPKSAPPPARAPASARARARAPARRG